jgi:hypothetical protein
MKKISTYLCVAILSGSATTCRVDAQGLSEGDFVQAGAAGLGAGLAASGRHGQVATRSYEAMLQARQAALLQTKTIEHYMSLGADYQTKRQLANAEAAYKYVLLLAGFAFTYALSLCLQNILDRVGLQDTQKIQALHRQK